MKIRINYLLGALLVGVLTIISCTKKTADAIDPEEEVLVDSDYVEEIYYTEVEETNEVVEAIPPKLVSDIPMDPDVRIGDLPNGMKYYIQRNVKPENSAELRLVVDAGSMQEDEDQLGLAHFVEHMCFNGTKNFEKNELVNFLESVGTRFGPDLNAYTSFDETVYMLQVRTDSAEIFQKGMLILEDWASNVSFDNEEIDKERGVVESEWRTRLSGEQRMQNEYFPIMYKNSRYAERLPIGDPEIIRNADYETVKRFYRDWYRPDLMAVMVVGDINVEEVEKDIIDRFSKIQNPENPREKKDYDVPRHAETLVSICSDEEATFPSLRVMWKHEKKPNRTVDDYRARMVSQLYNRMLNTRLSELSRKENPPFRFAYSGYGGDVGNLDTYTSMAQYAEGKAMVALEAVLTENQRVLKHGFLRSELERQKLSMMERMERAYKEKDKTESSRLVRRYVNHFLRETPIPSIEQQLELYDRFMESITVEEINSLASQWITEENRFILVTGPKKDDVPMPTEAEVLEVVNNMSSKPVEPYVDNAVDKPLFNGKLSMVDIVSEKSHETVGVNEFELANGVKVIAKKTDFKNNQILMSATSEGGTSLYSDEDYQSASTITTIMGLSGVSEFDATQLQKLLTGKAVRVSPYISTLYEGMGGSSTPEDLETMMQLVYLYFTAPRKDESAFKAFKTNQTAMFENMMSNPQFFFMDQTLRLKYGDNPRYNFPGVEGLEQIDLDRGMEIYKERFADASDFAFVFVGNFDEAKLKELCQKYLGNLPVLEREETWKDLGIEINKGKIEKSIRKGKANKSQVELFYHGDFDWSPENNYKFQSMVSLLRIKMRESMREDKGGVYGVGVRGGTSNKPKGSYSITVSFNCDPASAEDLISTAINDIKNAKMNGASEEDLTKVKETQRQSRIKDLKENRFWSRQLEYYYENGLEYGNISLEALEKMISSLTSDDIKAAANAYFDENNSIKAVMMPEETKPAN